MSLSARSFARSLLPLALTATILAPAPAANACGPYFPERLLVNERSPDDQAAFLGGKVEIFERRYRPLWRIAAWRALSGKPLTAAEQKAFVPLPWSGEPSAMEVWNRARGEAGLASRWFSTDKWLSVERKAEDGQPYSQTFGFENCSDDALRTAAETLRARLATYGNGSPQVADWIANQEAVFSNCGERGGALPVELGSWAPAALRADRAYQFAAAYFYRGDFDQAAERFLAISRDSESTWRDLSLYLAARSFARKAVLSEPLGLPIDRAAADEAKRLARQVLNDKSRSRWHSAASELIEMLDSKLDPQQRFRDLSAALAKPRTGSAEEMTEQVRDDLADFLYLRDFGGKSGGTSGEDTELAEWIDVVWSASSDEVVGGQSSDPSADLTADSASETAADAAASLALERWRKRKTAVWLVAALALAKPQSEGASELMAAAEKLDAKSPAYWTANYHRLRLGLALWEPTKARAELDQALSRTKGLGPSALARLRSLRFAAAENLSECLAFGTGPLVYEYGGDQREIVFTSAAYALLNGPLPLARLVEVAENPTTEPRQRREVAALAWTRAVLFGRDVDRPFAQRAAAVLAPEIPAVRDWSTSKSSLRSLEALRALLRSPGFDLHLTEEPMRTSVLSEIDSLRQNWWCQAYQGEVPPISWPRWLATTDRDARTAELELLSEIEAGPTYLGRWALKAVEENPKHPAAAEVLHLVVRATRYGCTDEHNGEISKRAFELLHRRYGASEWAKKTPYWFE